MSASVSVRLLNEEGIYSISQDEMSKKMRAFQQSAKLSDFIRSKLDSKGIGRISIDFEPKPLLNEIVSSWLDRSKGDAQILVSLNKTVDETMPKMTSGQELQTKVALLELNIAKLQTALSTNELENKQRLDRLEKQINDHIEKTTRQEEMLIVSDMLVNFYKAFVFVNREHFSSCFLGTNKINLEDFYDRLSNESTRNEIVSRINASTIEAAYDGLAEIEINVKRVRNGHSHPLGRIDTDFRLDFESYLSYLEEEVNQLTLFRVNGQFILDRMRELVKLKQQQKYLL